MTRFMRPSAAGATGLRQVIERDHSYLRFIKFIPDRDAQNGTLFQA
jgi:hypothetical protein